MATSTCPIVNARPFSGLAFKVITFNTKGLSSEKEHLLGKIACDQQQHAICLQETHPGPNQSRPKIAGMTLVAERPQEKYRSTVLVKDGLTVTSTLTSEENDNEIITVWLGDIAVTNVYKPPDITYAFPSGMTALNAHLWVVISDFNAHCVKNRQPILATLAHTHTSAHI